MMKFNKVLYLKIVSCIVAVVFLTTTISYAIGLPGETSLRVPVSSRDSQTRFQKALQDARDIMKKPTVTRWEFLKVAAILCAGLILEACSPAIKILTPTSPTDSGSGMVNAIREWITNNVDPKTGVFLSFKAVEGTEERILNETLKRQSPEDSIEERMVLFDGLIIYDGGAAQIFLALSNAFGKLSSKFAPAEVLLRVLWRGKLKEFNELHASKAPFRYVEPGEYDPISPMLDKRGFRFKIINARGKTKVIDRLTGATVTWRQWQAIAGENAWAGVLGPLQMYVQKYGRKRYRRDKIEMRLAEEIARVAMVLQAENDGIRFAPKGTWSPNEVSQDPEDQEWTFYEESTENNLSWYAAFRMLYEITGKPEYREAMEKVEEYLESSYDKERNMFSQGMHYDKGTKKWSPNYIFATDCQTWAIDVLGPEKIDKWGDEGAAYRLWQETKARAGIMNKDGEIIAVDFTERKDVKSVEWTAGAIVAAAELADYYRLTRSKLAEECERDAKSMYVHMQTMRVDLGDRSAWPYSDIRVETKHGWFAAGGMLSMASTAWMGFVELGVNPFFLGGKEVPGLLGIIKADQEDKMPQLPIGQGVTDPARSSL